MPQHKVLLVDDDPGVRTGITRVLEIEGYHVTASAEAGAVIELVERELPDIVLLDLGLGADNGWDVFEEVSREHPLIPVVIISAHSGQFEIARLAGVSAFVEKPIEIPQLLGTMRQLLAEDAETRLERLALRTPRPRFVPGRTRRRWSFRR